ncbi:MAG TPA: DUF1559 domain-containing protein, partial [Planctomycetia bacterium]|nr:DUF1559 domain-containing protein [Planctomycetia bacterium]
IMFRFQATIQLLAATMLAAAANRPAACGDYDWRYVPKNAWLVVAARPAEVLARKEFKTPAFADALKVLNEDVPTTDIEEWRLFVFGENVEALNVGMVLRFAKPIPKERMLKGLFPAESKPTSENVEGKEVYTVQAGPVGQLAVLDERTYLFVQGLGAAGGLTAALASDGSESPAVKRAAELSGPPFVLSLDFAVIKKMLAQLPPGIQGQIPVPGLFEALDKMNALVGTITLDPKVSFKVTLETASDDNAVGLKTLITSSIALAKASYAGFKESMFSGIDDDEERKIVNGIYELGAKALEELETTQDGAKVNVALIEFLAVEEFAAKFGPVIAMSATSPKPNSAAQEANNLRQIGLALHNYHSANNKLPADITDKDGKPLLSWRVELLPYLNAEPLSMEIKRDEPWDSEHNRKLLEKMPAVFMSKDLKAAADGKTCWLAIKGKGYAWESGRETTFAQITDGLSNTVAVVKAAEASAVEWMKPDDLDFDAGEPTAKLADRKGKFLALVFDGSTRNISLKAKIASWFTIAGGEPIEAEEKDKD